MITSPQGTSDLLQEENKFYNLFIEKAQRVFGLYGYTSIQTPIFEQTNLFVRSVGEDSDIVNKEMYNVISDGNLKKLLNGEKVKSKSLFSLRPEGTASIVRSVIENNLASPGSYPAKLMYAGPMFRAERPQAGRKRQFMQVGIECIGADSPTIDAEAINMLADFYNDIGLTDYQLIINSIGCSECRTKFKKELLAYLKDKDLCSTCQERVESNPLRVFDCKEAQCQDILDEAPKIIDYLCQDCQKHYDEVKEKIKIKYTENPKLVRGLDYYTNTVFEVSFPGLDAIAGGGRYDGLVESLDGPKLPGFGFALGYERTLLALQKLNFKFEEVNIVECFIACVDDSCRNKAFEISQMLREAKISCDIDHQGKSLKSQFKIADKLKVKYVIVIGPEELSNDQVSVRNMKTHDQENISIDKIFAYISNGGKL